MSFKMIANRHVYRIDDKKEYKKGESFTVKTETEKNRLVRNGRARVDDSPPPLEPTKSVETRRAPIAQRVMTAEDSVVEQPSVAPIEAFTTPKQNRYRRSDLRSED